MDKQNNSELTAIQAEDVAGHVSLGSGAPGAKIDPVASHQLSVRGPQPQEQTVAPWLKQSLFRLSSFQRHLYSCHSNNNHFLGEVKGVKDMVTDGIWAWGGEHPRVPPQKCAPDMYVMSSTHVAPINMIKNHFFSLK